jgi:DNA-binding transcriptional LysR family regulator
MTLEQIKIFVEAARYNSFTSAAQRLGLTQSAISISIRKLEEELKVSLFERIGRKVVVSKAGQILLNEGERLLRDVELTVKRIESYQGADGARAVLACTRNAYDFWMPGILASMASSELPAIDLICGTAAEVSAWVMRGTADVGLSESKPGHTELRYHGVFRDMMVLCASQDWKARQTAEPSWATLGDFSPLIWERETDLEPFLLQELEHRGLNAVQVSEKRLRLKSTAAVLSLVQSGRYAGFVTLGAARHLLGTASLSAVDGFQVPIPYWIFAPRHREIEPLAALVARAASQISGESSMRLKKSA